VTGPEATAYSVVFCMSPIALCETSLVPLSHGFESQAVFYRVLEAYIAVRAMYLEYLQRGRRLLEYLAISRKAL